jgi:hypothetical protein
MIIIIWSLYVVIIITFAIIAGFIAYHLKKYSLNAPLNKILLPLFMAISVLLVFSNLLLFSSIDWAEIISRLPH